MFFFLFRHFVQINFCKFAKVKRSQIRNKIIRKEDVFHRICHSRLYFLIIGAFHPIVIKVEYYFGTRPWWLFLLAGIACIISSISIENTFVSALIGVVGASLLWSIGELFEQKKRVEKGWFPMNPKRKDEYINKNIKNNA